MVIFVILYYIILTLNVAKSDNDIFEYQQTLKEFCHNKEIHILTIQPELQPYLCPQLVHERRNNTHKYICNKLNVNTTTIYDYQHQKLYNPTKVFWKRLLNRLINHLGNHQVLFVGDSLTTNSYFQLKCLGEFASVSIPHVLLSVASYPSPFIRSSLYSFSYHTHVMSAIKLANEEQWYHYILERNPVKYVIFNTGMWWKYFAINSLKTNSTILNNDELLEAYQIYFESNGPFLGRVTSLIHNYNITVLWRDTYAAGSCIPGAIDISWDEYRKAFSTMNLIAHKALRPLGVLIIPNVWNISLSYWKLHPGDDHDYGHYCIFQNQSLDTSIIKNIINLILEN